MNNNGVASNAMKVVSGLIMAGIVGLTGWALATASRVSALEARAEEHAKVESALRDDLRDIKTDLREVRNLLLTHEVRNARDAK